MASPNPPGSVLSLFLRYSEKQLKVVQLLLLYASLSNFELFKEMFIVSIQRLGLEFYGPCVIPQEEVSLEFPQPSTGSRSTFWHRNDFGGTVSLGATRDILGE